ncbi:MAG: Ni/Fe hydrogenase subunit alpha [Nanoarchaeota archaeon]|nr:Ni/Fe hydrogenase subunit alpha [Nanoarchaeota archaeon]
MTTINLDHLTKIEGHARLRIKVKKGQVEKVKLQIFEGSRYFEGILKDKKYNDLSPISSRICGICSPVHATTSVLAVEKCFGVQPTEQTNKLRELLIIGGMIQSHILHLYFLALPDFLGYENALRMAKDKKNEIMTALRIKRAGNNMVNIIGGRDIHPVASILGGFSRIPTKECVKKLINDLRVIQLDAEKTSELFYNLEIPKFEKFKEYFALTGNNYFYSHDHINCLGDKCIPVETYEQHFKEYFREGSTAEFASKETGKSYMVGAVARIINNHGLLSQDTQKYQNFIKKNKYSPFINNLSQAVEIQEGIKRSIEILESLDLKDEKPVEIIPKPGIGIAATEAPRGILFHKYAIDEKGFCSSCNITTPTTQNLQNIEENIAAFLPTILDKPKEQVILEIEKLIRAYDPCISCATHFLKVDWEKE